MNSINTKSGIPGDVRFLRCANYLRVSTDEQAREEHYSLDSQDAVCFDLIRQRRTEGFIHRYTFTDAGYTGFDFNRPGLIKLIAAVKRGEIDIVVAYKRDRLFRNADLAAQIEGIFAAHGVRVLTTEAFCDASPHSVLFRQFIDSNAQFERANIRLRIKDCLRFAAKKGDWKAGIPPFGYNYEKGSKTLTINETEAATVKLIYNRAAEGAEIYEILRELRSLHIYGRPRKKPKLCDDEAKPESSPSFLTSTYIKTIISNPTYRGIVRVKKTDTDHATANTKIEWEEFKGRHVPIIAEDLWYRANRELKKPCGTRHRKPLGTTLGLLSELISCGCCDCAMTASSASRLKSSGQPHRYYRCSQLVKGGPQSTCSTRQISCEAVESAVLSLIHMVETNPASFSRLGFENTNRKRDDLAAEIRSDLLKIEESLLEQRRIINNFITFVQKGEDNPILDELMISAEAAKSEATKLEYQRIQSETRLHKLTSKTPPLSEMSRAFRLLAQALTMGDAAHKREIYQRVIRKVTLRRISVSQLGNNESNKRTFRMNVEFRTDHVLNFGETDLNKVIGSMGYTNIELKVSLEISSNRKEQKILLMEAGYSVISSTFDSNIPPQTASPGVENPIQRALRWKLATADGLKTASALATEEKVSKGLISQHIALLNLPQVIVEFMKEGRDHKMANGFSLRELQRLLLMKPQDAITRFRERITGQPLQEVIQLTG